MFALRARPLALLEAFLTTVLWATSFLFLRRMLPFVGPITLAGLRYLVAFALLAVYALAVVRRRPRALPWITLAIIGVLQFGVGQALQYAALRLLPVATIAVMFSLLPLLQAVADAVWLKEPPGRTQLVGAAVTLGGVAVYLPWAGAFAWDGLVMVLATLVLATIATTLSRGVARTRETPTLYLTMVSMGAGAVAVLPVGLAVEAAPRLSTAILAALLWLSLANTAGAFSLWNHALQTLTAFEANLIGNTTLVQVGILGWLFLGEALSARQVVGMGVALAGIVLGQLPALRPRPVAGTPASIRRAR